MNASKNEVIYGVESAAVIPPLFRPTPCGRYGIASHHIHCLSLSVSLSLSLCLSLARVRQTQHGALLYVLVVSQAARVTVVCVCAVRGAGYLKPGEVMCVRSSVLLS